MSLELYISRLKTQPSMYMLVIANKFYLTLSQNVYDWYCVNMAWIGLDWTGQGLTGLDWN